jgi:hypothetical protein
MIVELSSQDVMRLTTDGEVAVGGGVVTLRLALTLNESVVNGAASTTSTKSSAAPNARWMTTKFEGRCTSCAEPLKRFSSTILFVRTPGEEKNLSLCRTCGEGWEKKHSL